MPVIFFESKHRIKKTLEELRAQIVTSEANYDIVVGRELTKKFERVYRGDIDSVINQITEVTPKGEFVIAVHKQKS